MWERHQGVLTRNSIVLILGDARNNYHASQAWVLGEMRKKARHVYWLNPEPRGYWDTGDSIISEYAKFCDGVFECRNLRQLERFVATYGKVEEFKAIAGQIAAFLARPVKVKPCPPA